MLAYLEKKDINPNMFAKKIIQKPVIIIEYLKGLYSKNETYSYNCFKILNIVTDRKPDIMYSHWDFFVNLLKSDNNYHKMSAIIIIANLTAVDTEKKFENIFDMFYENLKSSNTIVPIYIVKSSGKIVKYKPELEGKITRILLDIEKIHPGKQIELVKSAVIESFSEYFNKTSNKDKIIFFIEKQINSKSPKTRKTAKEFIKKYVEK